MTDTKNKTNFCPEFELTNSEQEVARAHNSGFKKLAVQCSTSTFVVKIATFAKPETVMGKFLKLQKNETKLYEIL